MAGILEGYRILDLTNTMPGAVAGMLLVDQGAEVIKVEPPGGVSFRDFKPFRVWNRAKKSVVLDLTAPSDLARFYALAATADVLLEGFQPGVATGLGIGYEEMHARLPKLIYVSVSAYGQTGSRKDRPGYEALVSARLGVHARQAGYRPGPHFTASPVASYGAALLTVLGIIAALYARIQTGTGQQVDVSMEDGVLALSSMQWRRFESAAVVSGMSGPPRRILGGIWECSDGRYLILHSGAAGAFSRGIKVFGLEDRVALSDSPHEISMPLEPEEAQAIQTELPRILKSKPRDYWLEKLRGADVGVNPVEPPGVALNDPQVNYNGTVATMNDPELGPIKTIGNTIMAPGASAKRIPAPRPGEHTQEVLSKLPERRSQADGVAAGGAAATGKPPFNGIRILDFGAYIAGPYGPKLLGDFGADVIKVEQVVGEQMRGLDVVFAAVQAGKRDLAVDLKTAEGKQLVQELLKHTDLISHNMRPGAAERMGIGYEQVRQIKPDIVYLHAPGWGSKGPKAHVQSFQPLQQAYCGPQWMAAGKGNPPIAAVISEDNLNDVLGSIGLALGLLGRERTGESQYVECSQLNAMIFGTSEVILTLDNETVFSFEIDKEQTGYGPLYRLYQTADGWICITVCTEQEWQALVRTPSFAGLAADSHFATLAGRNENADALADVLAERFASLATAEAFDLLDRAGVPCEMSAADIIDEYLSDDENLRLGRVLEYHLRQFGAVRDVGLLIRFSETPGRPWGPPPLLGEHTQEIMQELGYSEATIADLATRRIVNLGEAAQAAAT